MLHLIRRVFVCVLFVGCAGGLLATGAWADSIGGGELYGVYANDGVFFNEDGSVDTTTSYTVIHHASFGSSHVDASGRIPDLIPTGFPSAFEVIPQAVDAGGQFFLVGFLNGAEGDDDHFVIGAGGIGDAAYSPSGSRHDELLDGTAAMGDGLEGPIDSLTFSEFWGDLNQSDGEGALTDAQFAEFFFDLSVGDGLGPVGTLHETFLSFDGSEDLFGYTGSGQLVATIEGLLNDVTITSGDIEYSAVPEPATFALLLGGLAVGAAARRRRRAG